MKRISLITALLGVIVLAFAGVASADTWSSSTPGGSSQGGASGKGAAVTHYTTSYTDSFFGPVSCTGVQQVKAKQPMQDSFTCTSTSGAALASVQPGQVINWGAGMWLSDADHTSLDKTFNATVSADGMSYTAVATY